MISLTAALLFPVLAPPAPQQSGAGDRATRIAETARNLAREPNVPGWSEKLLARGLDEATGVDERTTLMLARCDVLRLSTATIQDPREQLEALGEAGQAYRELLAMEPGSGIQQKAQSQLGNIAFQYGYTLQLLMEEETLSEEERSEYVGTAEEIFTEAIRGMNAIIAWWKRLPEGPTKNQAKFETYFPTEFYRALTYLYWAQLYPPDSLERGQYADQAVGYLEDFAIKAGGFPSLLAYKRIADAYAVQGDQQTAFDYYQYVIESAVPQDADLSAQQVEQRQGAMQQAFHGLIDMLRDSGRLAEADQWIAEFDAWVDRERIFLDRDGYRVRLIQAERLIDRGEIADAIDIADRVARDNPQSTLRLAANRVMSRAIAEAPPGAVIPLDILYQAAEGAYYEDRYDEAVEGFRVLLPRLAGDPDADEYGAKAYYFLGRSWLRLDRPLLAVVAHEDGFENYPDDPEFAERNVLEWERISGLFYQSNPSDDFLRAYNERAADAVAELGIGGGNREFKNAETAYEHAQRLDRQVARDQLGTEKAEEALQAWQRAIAAFERVSPEEQRFYEEAMVRIGECEWESIRYDPTAADRAIAQLEKYLNEFVADPANEPEDRFERKVRSEMEPAAVFYLAASWRHKARTGDPSGWNEVLALTEDFLEEYPEQTQLGWAGKEYRIEAHVAQGNVDRAEAEYQELMAIPARDVRLASAAYDLYTHYATQIEQAETVDEKRPRQAKAAEYLSYINRFSARRMWPNLVGEADLRAAIGEHARAEELYEQVLEEFANDPTFTEAHEFNVKMSYIESLLAQRKTGQAVPLVDEVYADRPKNRRVKQVLIMVKAGFLLWDEQSQQVVEVPGEGTPEALELASTEVGNLLQLARLEAGEQDPPLNPYYYEPWWHAKVSQAYVLLQRSRINPADKDKHVRLIESLEKQAPNLGRDIAGEAVPQFFRWMKRQS